MKAEAEERDTELQTLRKTVKALTTELDKEKKAAVASQQQAIKVCGSGVRQPMQTAFFFSLGAARAGPAGRTRGEGAGGVDARPSGTGAAAPREADGMGVLVAKGTSQQSTFLLTRRSRSTRAWM